MWAMILFYFCCKRGRGPKLSPEEKRKKWFRLVGPLPCLASIYWLNVDGALFSCHDNQVIRNAGHFQILLYFPHCRGLDIDDVHLERFQGIFGLQQ